MTIIGLTGPTGAGKGEVGRLLAAHGALIIDTDKIAREVVRRGEPTLAALAQAFGQDILLADGSLDRAALAAKAFQSRETQQRLNAITHPAIIARSKERLENSTAPLAVIDAPLLFEAGMDTLCDTTVAVLAPASVRRARIMKRDGISQERATERMRVQPDDAFYLERADHTLINDGDRDALALQVGAFLTTLKEAMP